MTADGAAPADGHPPAGNRTPARLATKPSWLLSQAAMHGHRLLADGLAPAGSRGYHYRLLAALEESGPASQARLGSRAGMDRSDVVAALNDLAARGMVQRTPDPADRRRNIVTITRPGERTCGGSTGCWPGCRRTSLPRCHPPNGRSWCACSPGCWSITVPSGNRPPGATGPRGPGRR